MTRAQSLVAAIVVAAVSACVGLIYYTGQQVYRTIGPSKAVAARDGDLYLLSHGKIHVFAPDGKRRNAYSLESLGASLTPSDLAVHRDGRVVVASPDGSNLRRCELSTGACETLDPNLTRVPLQPKLPLNSVKIAIDEDRGRYFLSDNWGHRVVETDFAGKRIAATQPYVVWYPNQLALEGANKLRVVDTNHRRIATLSVDGASIGPVTGAMNTEATGIARPGRMWPFDAVRLPSGETWALVATEGMKDADLIVYDANGHASRRIDLGSDSDPFDIEVWRDRVIVSDATNYRVEAIGLDGKRMAALDDADFDKELAAASERSQGWRVARVAAQIAVVGVPLLAVVVLKLLGAPVTAPALALTLPAASPAPLDANVRWIGIRPGFYEDARRELKKTSWLMLGMVIVLGVFWYFVFGAHLSLDSHTLGSAWILVGLVAIQMLTIPLGMKRAGRQFEGYRLGVSSSGLDYELPKVLAPFGNAKGRAPWREVFWDGTRLMAGKKLLALRANRGPALFDPGELQASIVAHVPKANHLTQNAMTMRATGPLLWVLVLAIAAVAAWLILARPL